MSFDRIQFQIFIVAACLLGMAACSRVASLVGPPGAPALCVSDAFDPADDTVSGANPLPLNGIGRGGGAVVVVLGAPTPTPIPSPTPGPTHLLAWPCDTADWYVFTASYGNFYTVTANGAAGNLSRLDLYNASMAVVASATGSSPSVFYDVPLGASGTYYLRHSISGSGQSFRGSLYAADACKYCPE